jgi:dihydrofolate synthase/folylpolyglutamate synthase
MNYKEARSFIEGRPGVILPGLERMEALLEELQHPERDLRFIHIAGTNGKGSVLSYISTVLSCAGYRVGRYISPTLYSYRERFQINGGFISREDFTRLAEKTADAVKRMEEKGFPRPSAFEMETALGFLYFKEQKCDWTLLECGMGGRGDATNVIPAPELAVFASISMDHMQYLGSTLAEIAEEKAGILKEGSCAVTCRQKPEVMEVLERVCREKSVPLLVADAAEAEILRDDLEGQDFRYHGARLEISLTGSCQTENAVTALEALNVLKRRGWTLPDRAVSEGFRTTAWNGRFTCIGKKPYFFVDGAHNPDAAEKLRKSIERYFPEKRLIYIQGVFADKDYREIIRITAPLADEIFTVATPGSKRALPAEQLAEAVAEVNSRVQACAGLKEAVRRAYGAAGEEDVILAFGSLSFIGELTEIVRTYRE